MPKQNKSRDNRRNDVGETSRPDASDIVEGGREPEEVTGRASATDEDVAALFANDTQKHLADGFRGGSNADPGSELAKEEDTDPNADEDVTAV